MSVSRRDLLAERARLVEQAKSYHESAATREWTPEETAKVDEIVALIADHDARIAAIELAMAEEVSGEDMPAEAPAVDPAAQQQAARARLSDVLSASSRRTRPAPVPVVTPSRRAFSPSWKRKLYTSTLFVMSLASSAPSRVTACHSRRSTTLATLARSARKTPHHPLLT
jgi:hypothetical protein